MDMKENTDMKEKILEMLSVICDDDVVKEDLDIDLFDNDLLDSLAIAELLVTIEDQFGLVLSPTEITRDDIKTPNRLAALIQSRC